MPGDARNIQIVSALVGYLVGRALRAALDIAIPMTFAQDSSRTERIPILARATHPARSAVTFLTMLLEVIRSNPHIPTTVPASSVEL